MTLSNFHAHTTYCDGSESCEEMVRAAVQKGLVAFGLSGHAYMGFETDWCMSPDKTAAFVDEMTRLKETYGDRITLFTGIEQDYYATEPTAGFDYVIGSCHYIKKDGEYLLVDESDAVQQDDVTRHYGGDFYAYFRDFYATAADIARKTNPDFIGHFDLVTKFNEGGRFFDEADKRYQNVAIEALVAVLETHRLFEINTGAMYRVGKKAPYPAAFLLKELKARGGEIILSSDSHDGASICYQFSEAAELAKACGFQYAKTLTTSGFVDYPL
ncbi:histidinol-phosphatase [Oscillospiraceae bacterium CM]|nr:histidinol-phosphatase [Oscillospiraceae bacterium CM]